MIKRIAMLCILNLLFFICPLQCFAADNVPDMLDNLIVENGTMASFNPDIYSYTVELDEGQIYADITVVPSDIGYTIQIDGDEEPIEPGKEQIITVSVYKNSDVAEYTLHVYGSGVEDGLTFLQCTNGTMSPMFNESVHEYYIILSSGQGSADLRYRAKNPDATITVEGNEDLKYGERTCVTMKVLNPDGKTSVYLLYIYRRPAISSNIHSECLLTSLEINNGSIPIEFNQKTGYYKIAVPKRVKEISITAIAQDRANVVLLRGSNVMSQSEPTIISVIVANPDESMEAQSIYTLEFYYDSFTKAEEFTGFQVLAAAVGAGTLVALIAGAAFYIGKRKKNRTAELTAEDPVPAAAADAVVSETDSQDLSGENAGESEEADHEN